VGVAVSIDMVACRDRIHSLKGPDIRSQLGLDGR
jgi:hypothetical protein